MSAGSEQWEWEPFELTCAQRRQSAAEHVRSRGGQFTALITEGRLRDYSLTLGGVLGTVGCEVEVTGDPACSEVPAGWFAYARFWARANAETNAGRVVGREELRLRKARCWPARRAGR